MEAEQAQAEALGGALVSPHEAFGTPARSRAPRDPTGDAPDKVRAPPPSQGFPPSPIVHAIGSDTVEEDAAVRLGVTEERTPAPGVDRRDAAARPFGPHAVLPARGFEFQDGARQT